MSHDDPGRWLDDPALSADLRQVLESARADEPTPAQLEALEEALGPLLDGPPGGGGGGGEGAPTGLVGGTAIGLGVAAAVVALGLFGAHAARPGGEEPVSPPVVAAAAEEPAAPPPSVGAAAAPRGAEQSPPTPASAAPAPADEPSLAPTAAPAAPADVVAAPAPNDIAAEARLLGEMRRAGPAGVLSLARRHAREHPRGELTQEREVLVVEALAALGRGDAARRRAARFERRYPGSGHGGRVRAAVAGLGD